MSTPAIPTQWLWSDNTYGTIAANVSAGATIASVHAVQGTLPVVTTGQGYTAVINPNLSGLTNNSTTENVFVQAATASGSVQFGSPLLNNHSVGENFVLVADSVSLTGISNSAVTQPTQVNPGDSLQYTTASVWDNVPQQFNVKAWGAVGNGVADDTAAIQSVINYVQSGGASVYGGTIFFPPGTYKITNTLTISGTTGIGIDLQGDGSTKATIALYLSNAASVGGSVVPVPALSWHNNQSAVPANLPQVVGGIKGITIDGLNAFGNACGFDFGDIVNLSLQDFQINNFYGGTAYVSNTSPPPTGGKPHLSGTIAITSGNNTFNDTSAIPQDVGKQVSVYSVVPNGASVTQQEVLGYVVSNVPGTSTTIATMPTWAGTSTASVVVDYAFNCVGINMNCQYFICEESQWWGVLVNNNRVGIHITRTYRTDTGINLTTGQTVFADANATAADIYKTVKCPTYGYLPGYIANVASGSVTMSTAMPSGTTGTNLAVQIGGYNSWDYTKMHDVRVQGNDRQTGILIDNDMFAYGVYMCITGNFGYENYYTPFMRLTSGANNTITAHTAIRGSACHIAIENDSGVSNSGIDFQVDANCALILNGNIQTSNFGESLINSSGLFNYTGVIITESNAQGGAGDSSSNGGILVSTVGVDSIGYISPASNNLNTAVSSSIWSGVGIPSASLGANGDFYFRQDGSSATTHLYFKASGSWSGIA